MTQRFRFTVSEALIMLAFGYSVNGYIGPSVYAALCAVFLTISSHTWKRTFRCLVPSVLWFLPQMMAAGAAELPVSFPGIWAVMLCNSFICCVWLGDSFRVLDGVMPYLFAMMTVLYLLACLLDVNILSEMSAAGSAGEIVILISVIFLPIMLGYAARVLAERDGSSSRSAVQYFERQ